MQHSTINHCDSWRDIFPSPNALPPAESPFRRLHLSLPIHDPGISRQILFTAAPLTILWFDYSIRNYYSILYERCQEILRKKCRVQSAECRVKVNFLALLGNFRVYRYKSECEHSVLGVPSSPATSEPQKRASAFLGFWRRELLPGEAFGG